MLTRTPLSSAAWAGRVDILLPLDDGKVDPGPQDEYGWTGTTRARRMSILKQFTRYYLITNPAATLDYLKKLR